MRGDALLSIVTLRYTADLPAIDAAMPRHVAWLAAGFESGAFLAAGRQQPRSGGVIVMRGDRATAEAASATDPFVADGLATADVTEFRASFAAPALAGLLA